jgi:hypothetical protein
VPKSKRANELKVSQKRSSGGFVEAVELLDCRDLGRVELAAAAGLLLALAQLREGLLDGPAGNELDQDEGGDEHAEKRRQHQEKPGDDVAGHRLPPPVGAAHQVWIGHGWALLVSLIMVK